MRISYHDQQVLNRLRDGAEAQIRGILRGNLDDTPPGQGQVSSLMEFISPILDFVLREARDWGYSARDAMPEPDQKRVEAADKIVGDSEKGYRDSRIGAYIKW